MPMSVTVPVRCVVRTAAPEMMEVTALCRPMMKQSSMTVMGSVNWISCWRRLPMKPKISISTASSASVRA